MNSKSNNKNRDDSPALPSSASHSPYNLRRNQSQPGAVTKRSNTTKAKKDISITIRQPSSQHALSSTPQNEEGLSEISSHDEENLENNDMNDIVHSDEEGQSEDNDTSDAARSDEEEQSEDNDASDAVRSDEEDESKGSDTSDMACSHNEDEALMFIHRAERRKNKPALVWSYFNRLGNNIYQCERCLKCIKTSNNSDTNLRSHLGRLHQMYEVMYNSQRQQSAPKLDQIKPEKKRELDKAAVDCIITDARPFGDFRRPGIYGPNRKTVRRNIGILYHEYRAELRETFASINSIAVTIDIWTKRKTSFICLTGHVFNKEFESIPIVLGFRHFSSSHSADKIKKYIIYELKQLQIEDKVCGFVTDNGSDIVKAINGIKFGQRFSCIAHDLNRVVKNGLQLWDTKRKKKEKLIQTTTDLSNDDVLTENDVVTEDDSESEFESDLTDVPEEFEDDEDDYFSGADDEANGGRDDHTENDSYYEDGSNGEEDESNGEDDEREGNNHISIEENFVQSEDVQFFTLQLIKRIRACIKNIRDAQAITNYVKKQGKLREPMIKCDLVPDIEIRWNTTYIMLDRFNMYRFIIHEINSQPSKVRHSTPAQQKRLGSKQFEFTNADWRYINDLQNILQPFFVATNIISAKNYPTLAAAYSVRFALRHFLFKISENDSEWVMSLKARLGEVFNLYFEEKMEQNQKNITLVAAFLDPNEYCHLRQCPSDLNKALALVKVEMKKETKTTSQSTVTCGNSQSIITPTSNVAKLSSITTKNSSIETLFSICGVGSSSTCVSTTKTTWSIDEEIGFYLSCVNGEEQWDFSSFWKEQQKRLPLMSDVVRRINIIPASSVPCESAFSVAGYIKRKQRSALSPTTLRYLLVLKDRYKLHLLKG